MITDQQKTRINELISGVEGILSRVDKGVVKCQEAEDFFAEQIRQTKGFFDKNSDEWRIIDRWEQENGYAWKPQCKAGSYAGNGQKEKLTKLTQVLFELIPEGIIKKKELHFTIAETYEAKRYVASIFRSAGAKLTVVDEHLDDQFFEYIDIIPTTVAVRVITGDQKPIFWTLFSELKKKNQNVDARVNGVSHCRYIIIDDSVIYSTDASLNTIGKKDFMIHQLEDDSQITKVKNEVEGYWSNGKVKV